MAVLAFLVGTILCPEERQNAGETYICSLGVNGVIVQHTQKTAILQPSKCWKCLHTARFFFFSSCKSWQINMSRLPHSLSSIRSGHWIIVYWQRIKNSLLGLNPGLWGCLKEFGTESWEPDAQLPLAVGSFQPFSIRLLDNFIHIMCHEL